MLAATRCGNNYALYRALWASFFSQTRFLQRALGLLLQGISFASPAARRPLLEWETYLDQLSYMFASAFDGVYDREDVRQALLEKLN